MQEHFIKSYHSKDLTWKDFFLLMALALTVIFFPILYGLWRANYGFMKFGPVAAEAWSRPWLQLSLAGLIPVLLLSVYRLSRFSYKLNLFEWGFNYYDLSVRSLLLRKPYKVLWSDVSGITVDRTKEQFFGIALRKKMIITIFLEQTKAVKIDPGLDGLQEAVEEIKKKVYSSIYPNIKTSFSTNQWVDFASIQVHRTGIRINGSQFSWIQVGSIEIKSGRLLIHIPEGKTRSFRVGKIPNIELFLQLIDQSV